ncbi:hypothetical protein [Bacillus sp. Au-Bac7]|uniref:hypothetical protein n=1 Tax=Bacillus sp. Au-Bac7 TaxID=2906458 RepID=UPI001E31A9BB|nr:hypothetical protein [Bacillus sp. Au-Bac7]MCE4052125.1 hypothetical protein [Bacillus sp. Au-Bac7]
MNSNNKTNTIRVQSNIGTRRSRATSLFTSFFLLGGALIILVVLWLLYLVTNNLYITTLLVIGFIFGYEFFLRKRCKYYAYPISNEEFDQLKNVRLIHYSNTMTEDDYEHYTKTGFVRLHAKKSAAKNYVMKFKDKRKEYIWFHQEETNEEPNFDSFIFTHAAENKPRKYKIIVELNTIPQERILLRPDNQNIIIIGDLEIPGTIRKEFNFYNQELYHWYLIKHKLELLNGLKVIYVGSHQAYGKLIDYLVSKKEKITTQ